MKIRVLSHQEVEAAPQCIWNAYVDLLAMEEYHDLTPAQQAAHLVFWYESEMQNGGHLQYFENRGVGSLAHTIEALGILGADCQQEVLREAGDLWLSQERQQIDTADEFAEAALEDQFGEFDARFHDCSPALSQCLEAYLEQHQSSFVTIA